MRELYTTEYVNKYIRKRSNYKISYVIISILTAIFVVGLMVYYAFEPYGTNLRVPFLVLIIIVTILFIIYSFIHFGYTYGTVNKYYRYLVFSVCGKRTLSKVTVLNVLRDPVDKDGFDCYRIIILEWSDITNDYVERTLYVDYEISITDLSEGDIITVSTNSNYLLAYKKETV